MLGIGMPELIVILVVALMVFGPKKLPDLAKSIARGMAEFKKATQEIKTSLNMDEDLRDIKRTFDEEMWRTLDKASSNKTDPFKSSQEEIDEQWQKHGEDSGDKEGRSHDEDQTQQKELDRGITKEGHNAQAKTIQEPEAIAKEKGTVEEKGG
jgi:TatA/E family protein of Tat protein translocase